MSVDYKDRRTIERRLHIPSAVQALPISSEGARKSLHHAEALEESREVCPVCTVLHICIAYVSSEHGKVS
jgi:hypothetical protein